MKTLLLALLSFLSFSVTENAHEFHLSKSTINYDSDTKSLQITMHIFIDDLEVALAQQGVEKMRIGTGREAADADSYIASYIGKKMHIMNDQDTFQLSFLGKELSADLAAIWCYLETPVTKELGQVTIDNSLLMEIYTDQKNVMDIRKDKKRVKDWLFDIENHTGQMNF